FAEVNTTTLYRNAMGGNDVADLGIETTGSLMNMNFDPKNFDPKKEEASKTRDARTDSAQKASASKPPHASHSRVKPEKPGRLDHGRKAEGSSKPAVDNRGATPIIIVPQG
ncbi:hypothetical protein CYMTET_53323, partial [Cymbomonas tetramitiformis]